MPDIRVESDMFDEREAGHDVTTCVRSRLEQPCYWAHLYLYHLVDSCMYSKPVVG